MATQVGNHHFLQACNTLYVGNIHYLGHAAEVRGRSCTIYFDFLVGTFDV